MSKFLKHIVVLSIFSVGVAALAAPPRDYVRAVGSSTAYPFATVVAEYFGKTTKFKAPKIESIGSGVGIQLFCNGVGPEYPDLALASRRMTESELSDCQQNGVNSQTEIKFGYDGITIADSRKASSLQLTLKDLYMALAKQVPDPKNPDNLIPNPHRTWKDVNPELPDMAIRVFGPPPTSGTRDVFSELAMERGCEQFDEIRTIKAKDHRKFQEICHLLREDGAYIDSGESDNIIVRKLIADPEAVGIFGFNFYDRNRDRIQAEKINGIAPSWDSIYDHSYTLSRPLYLYVKNAHVDAIPGLRAFLIEFTSEKALGEEGYLVDKGLIPLPDGERRWFLQYVKELRSGFE